MLPTVLELKSIYPNPFNSTTTITYGLDKSTPTYLAVYDLSGRLVETLVEEKMEAGVYVVTWQADGFPSGLYLLRLAASGDILSSKMLLVK